MKVDEPYYSELDIKNPVVIDILNKSAELGFFTVESEIKYDSVDWEKESDDHTAIENLSSFKDRGPNGKELDGKIKYKRNCFADTTPGGAYFFEKMLPLLKCPSTPKSSMYNPKGHLGWHKDADYGVYVIMFSFCVDNPNGFFRWEDAKTGEIHTTTDKPGWFCKTMVSLDDTHSEWHACKTTTPKCSLVIIYPNYNDFLFGKNFIQSDK